MPLSRILMGWPRWAALMLVLVVATLDAQPVVQAVPEYNLKAGYLLQFARSVQWPAQAFASDDAPLVIAIVGRDPFGPVLDATLREQRVGTHPVQLRRIARPQAGVHVAFIADQQRDQDNWLGFYRERATLTVGESEKSLDAGVIVRLVKEQDRIRFDVDWAAAMRANLKIASPMLKSAREVRGGPAELNHGAQP